MTSELDSSHLCDFGNFIINFNCGGQALHQ